MEDILRFMSWIGVMLAMLFLVEPICFGQQTGTVPKSQRNKVKEFMAKQLAAGLKANPLAGEKSPYLLQHAFNQVDWYPCGEEAFAKASLVKASMGDDAPIMEVSGNVIENAVRSFARIYDKRHGGLGNASKFPRPVSLFFLLRYYQRSKDSHTLEMVLRTMQDMANGGMYDQIGGGFHRYSVDSAWMVPHFEKMLYDQAQLAVAYFEAYQVSGESDYLRVATEVLDYVMRDLTDTEGGFYAAEDADSPMPEDPSAYKEGAFYACSAQDLVEILGAKKTLLELRGTRPRPHLDDKVLASWNGLMISAFSKGYQVAHRPEYLQAATDSATFIWQKLYDPGQMILFHGYRDGTAGIEATLDDYAFLVQGFLDLFEATSDYVWLGRAELLSKLQVKYFADSDQGGFFDTSGRDKTVLLRMKSSYDGAEPTGNSVAALNFLRLAEILSSQEERSHGEKTIKAFGSQLNQAPYALPQMLVALEFQQAKPIHIVVVGERNELGAEAMFAAVNSFFLPQRTILLISGEGALPKILVGREDLSAMRKINGRATAFLCEGLTCMPPTNDPAVLREMLSKM